jgi:succinate dehydrogenase / fumarate reductase flavoprotein subunit
MENYAPSAMELAPRDIVARAIRTEINEGRGFDGGYVHLDLRHLGKEKICKRLPGIRQICIDFGDIDPVLDPIPIQPGQHYSMGGIATDDVGKTSVENFYAVGECACVSVHGANRLGGNSLLDTVVFGRLAGEAIAGRHPQFDFRPNEAPVEESVRAQVKRVDKLVGRQRGVPHHAIRDRLRALCMEKVGIFRNETDLTEAVAQIGELREQYEEISLETSPGPFNFEIVHVLDLESLLYMSEITAQGALRRRESRGSHYRNDYPERDDSQWLCHTVARLEDDQVVFSYADVDVSQYEPQKRTY